MTVEEYLKVELMGFDMRRLNFLRWLVNKGRNPEMDPNSHHWKAA